jgi:hypothetical protein
MKFLFKEIKRRNLFEMREKQVSAKRIKGKLNKTCGSSDETLSEREVASSFVIYVALIHFSLYLS